MGVGQEFNEHGTSLSSRSSMLLPVPPERTDEIVVEYQTVMVCRSDWGEAAFGRWFRATWWHFNTAVPVREEAGGGGSRTLTTKGPVDRDLVGWVRESGMKFEPGATAVVRLPYR